MKQINSVIFFNTTFRSFIAYLPIFFPEAPYKILKLMLR